jgi:hypothetical protein
MAFRDQVVAESLFSVPPASMMLGAACALAGWGVLLFQCATAGAWPAETFRLHETRHFRSLASALGIGPATAAAGPMLSIRISFRWMMAMADLALAGLEGLRRSLAGGNAEAMGRAAVGKTGAVRHPCACPHGADHQRIFMVIRLWNGGVFGGDRVGQHTGSIPPRSRRVISE